ncbi:MAG: hypothetical protein JWQ71_4658 [Pedosphaera sp.]|nr:hypothetical protein [Pedosphaera sp.]
MKSALCSLLLSLIASGCAPWQYYDPAKPGVAYTPKPASYEMPILQRNEVARPFKDIGQVSALGGTYAMQRDMYKAIRSKARAIGADALVDVHYSDARLYPDIIATAITYTDTSNPEVKITPAKSLATPKEKP